MKSFWICHLALSGLLFCALGDFAPGQEPVVLVGSGVNDFALRDPKVFWHTAANCTPAGGEFPAFNPDKPEILTRIATSGGITRELLFENDSRPPTICNPYQFHSDIVADDEYIYWVDSSGLVRLSTDANVDDPPELLNATITGNEGSRRVELALASEIIYARTYDGSTSRIYSLSKTGGNAGLRRTFQGRVSNLSHNGSNLYWLEGSTLKQGFGFNNLNFRIAEGVTGYYAEGRRQILIIGGSRTTDYVWIGQGRNLVRFNNIDDSTSAPLYTSTNASAVIYDITSIGGNSLVAGFAPSGVFFFERRSVVDPNPPNFVFYDQLLFRIPRGGGQGDLLYFRNGTAPVAVEADDLANDRSFLYWKDLDRVLRHPADADALPQTNMRVTGMEVTQSIQDLQNNVRLIQGKRTFVRLHVSSDDPARAVPGVYAQLTVLWDGGSGGPLAPVNPGGSKITVYPDPDRNDINQSFLFEIPISWTNFDSLRFIASLNPQKLPLQQSYANNILIIGPLNFDPSPRFEMRFIAFKYEVGGTEYVPRYFEDILATYSWIRRAYPLASGPGDISFPGQGFRPSLWYVFDEDLGDKVMRTAEDCQVLKTEEEDNRSLCASGYTNSRMLAWQSENNDPRFYYGMISDGAKFPRGQASGRASTGPTGESCCGSSAWDFDGTYSDWYAGHEIGHSLGRAHPSPNSDDPATEDTTEGCGHSRSDLNYPYASALIGPAGGSLAGFDVGDGAFPRMVLPRTQWADMMSYCSFQWISDYTYDAIYNQITSEAGAGQGTPGRGPWLSVFGAIAGGDTAVIHYIRKVPIIFEFPQLRGNEFSLQLLDLSGGVLSVEAFGAESGDEDAGGAMRSFGVVVPFEKGTREARIVRSADGAVLVSQAISAAAPSLDAPSVQGGGAGVAGVTGIQQVNWSAMDTDGDSLSYDVLCSHDNGDTFTPLFWNLRDPSVGVDTDELGGGEAILRVVASDGVLCTEADSMPFSIALKPPVPRILAPSDGTSVQYGQLVTFVGVADDLQDGSVAPNGLSWGGLGPGRGIPTGSIVSTTTLPVGENTIVLTARNSFGLSERAEITVFVNDDLRVPGPTLTIGPQQVGWQVPAGATQLVTATLSISNSGTGVLNWTAQEDAPWLELSAMSGSVPEILTLTANPEGLEPNRAHLEELVISNDANAEQSITVPVALITGPVFAQEGGDDAASFRRGDCDGDGTLRGVVTDAVFLLNFNFLGTEEPPCLAACDANGDGDVRGVVTDAIYLLTYNFLGGPAPLEPSPDCGPGTLPTDAEVGCASPPQDCETP